MQEKDLCILFKPLHPNKMKTMKGISTAMSEYSENTIILKLMQKLEDNHINYDWTDKVREFLFLSIRGSVDAVKDILKETENEQKNRDK